MSRPNSARCHRHTRHKSDLPLLPVPEWQPRPSARSPKPVSLEHSFEDSERSTLPSAQPSARQPRYKAPRSVAVVPQQTWSLMQEIRELAWLRSMLLQWTLANGLAEVSEGRFTRRAEEEVFDRTLQLQDLLQETQQQRIEVTARLRAHGLREVLAMETDSLCTCEEEIVQVSEYLQEAESAALSSLHRLPLDIDERLMHQHLGMARNSLTRIHEHLAEVVPRLPQLSDRMERLCDIVQEERAEVMQALLSLTRLRSLYEEEKAVLLDGLTEAP